MIQVFSDCEKCKNDKICRYKELHEKEINLIGGIDEEDFDDIFKIGFQCTNFNSVELTRKKGTYDDQWLKYDGHGW